MNILAYIAIIALLGFIAAAAWMAATVLHMIEKAKQTAKIIDPARNSAVSIVSTGKRVGTRIAQRCKTIAAHGKRAAESVMGVKDEVAEAARSIDVKGVKSGAQETMDNLRSGSQLLKMFEELLQTVRGGSSSEAG